MAIVVYKDLECLYFDIKNTFTESELKEELQIKSLYGVTVKKGNVLRIL